MKRSDKNEKAEKKKRFPPPLCRACQCEGKGRMKHEFISQRAKTTQACPIGASSLCCRHCLIGPCRLIGKQAKGVCGAGKELVMARNLMRIAAAGTACHIGHAQHILNYKKQPMPKDIVKRYAPSYLCALWKKLGIYPDEPFEEISEALHQTAYGVDSDWKHVLLNCLKLGIVDGYYGLYLATELEDQTLSKPEPRKGWMDLGVISADKTNIAVHGHNPILPAKIVEHCGDANVVGVCCTGAELLARYGIPLAANMPFSEQVIATGAIEAMVVDTQCVLPSLADIAGCYHTKLITTHDIARMPGALHMPFTAANADSQAKKIVALAEANRKQRGIVDSASIPGGIQRPRTMIPSERIEIWAGWTPENMPITELKNKLRTGKLAGVVAFIGCSNPRVDMDKWAKFAERLIKNNYLVLTTGCIGYELGRHGLLAEKGKAYHLGSCVNNARVAEVFRLLAKGKITDENFLVSCPGPVSEKALSIGLFFTALGVSTHFGFSFLETNEKVKGFLEDTLREMFNSRFFIEADPEKLWKESKGRW